MKKLVFFILGVLLLATSVWGININEIMYNPPSIDNNKEFVEVLGTDNLSDYTIGDLASNDSLELLKFVSGNFSLIVEEGFNHTNVNCSVYSVGATIGNNLNNNADTIFLYYNNILIDFVSYDDSLANNNGYSLELINGSWQESCEIDGSPGQVNCFVINEIVNETVNETINNTINDTINETINDTINATVNETINNTINDSTNNTNAGLKLEIIIPDILFLSLTYDSLFKITNLEHVSGVESFVFVIVRYNVTKNNSLVKEDYFNKTINYYSSSKTGKLLFEETGNYTLCGTIINTSISVCKEFVVINPINIPCFIELNLSTDKEIYLNKKKVKIKNIVNNKSFPYIIEYWVEDLFGEEMKKKYNTSNTNQKTYTPKIVEKDRVLYVKNRLVFVACNNSNSNLSNEKMIIVKKAKISIGVDDDSDSNIGIDYVYLPKKRILNFGNNFKVKLSIHKGDTAKSVVSAFVEKNGKKVSDETKFYLNKKNADYNLTIRVFLRPNCENKFSDGYYDLVIEGLGNREEEEIQIKGNKKGVCKQEGAEKDGGEISSFYTRSKKYRELINLYTNIKGNEVYELVLQSKTDRQITTVNSSEKIKFSVKPEPGINLFILELRKKGRVIDTKTLLVELEGEEKKQILIKEVLLDSDNKTDEELNASVNYSVMPVTGTVVYESDNVKIIKYAPYLLSFVLSLIIVGLILSKRR